MELKDAQFERLCDAAKLYPDSTLIIRKQFFDGIIARFQDTIKTRTEMFIDEQKIRIGLAENLQKEYHKTFELKEELAHKKEFSVQCQMAARTLQRKLRHQKYKRCLAWAQRCMDAHCETEKDADFLIRWERRWLELANKLKEGV